MKKEYLGALAWLEIKCYVKSPQEEEFELLKEYVENEKHKA